MIRPARRVPLVLVLVLGLVVLPLVSCNGGADPSDDAPPPPAELPLPHAGPYRMDDPGSDCVGCHGEIVAAYRRGRKGGDDGPGIACAACHGDATDHILTMDPADIDSPAKLDLDGQEAGCVECHAPVDRPGWAAALRRSGCFASDGSLTCATCHDPHRIDATGAGKTVSGARNACAGCHAPEACSEPQENRGESDCADCHMPRPAEAPGGPPGGSDHTIRRRSR